MTDKFMRLITMYGGPWDTYNVEITEEAFELGLFKVVIEQSILHNVLHVALYERIGEEASFLFTGNTHCLGPEEDD